MMDTMEDQDIYSDSMDIIGHMTFSAPNMIKQTWYNNLTGRKVSQISLEQTNQQKHTKTYIDQDPLLVYLNMLEKEAVEYKFSQSNLDDIIKNAHIQNTRSKTSLAFPKQFLVHGHTIIDHHFREFFHIPRPSERYSILLSKVPDVFYGNKQLLKNYIKVMAYAIADEYPYDIPPWRTLDSMLQSYALL